MPELLRKGHFLGAKLRALRKRNGLTLEELSARCIQRDAARRALGVLPEHDRERQARALARSCWSCWRRCSSATPAGSSMRAPTSSCALPAGPGGGAARVPLEPAFLFSKNVLQAAIPELLAQTGTSGRQFAHLLIRSHQEMSRNDFPDLERAADSVGERRFPLSVEDLLRLCKRHGLEIRWFERKPVLARDKDREVRSMVRSFFEAPRIVYANRALQSDPARLKFDLAAHIAHKVLHGGDGLKSAHATGGEMGGSPEGGSSAAGMNAQDVLHAWRDFECSFFAGALLAPARSVPALPRRASATASRPATKLELTPAVIMRRMTKVSPYPYWHFFDAYPPGYLRAVYRGNGIPLPWGNLAQVSDPCPQLGGVPHDRRRTRRVAARRSPCCATATARCCTAAIRCACTTWPATRTFCRWAWISRRRWTRTASTARAIVESIFRECLHRRGEARIPKAAAQVLAPSPTCSTSPGSRMRWRNPARIICPRSNRCPRPERCEGARPSRAREIADVREEILGREG